MVAFLANLFKKPVPRDSVVAEIDAIIPVVDPSECSMECDTCTTTFPSQYRLLDDPDAQGVLWKTTANFDLHCVIPTGQTDWIHDATNVKGTVKKGVAEWGLSDSATKLVGTKGQSGSIKVTTSSLPLRDDTDPAYLDGTKADVLLLPHFVWVYGLTVDKVALVLTEVVERLQKAAAAAETVSEAEEWNSEFEKTIFGASLGVAETPAFPFGDVQGFQVEPCGCQAHIFLCSHRTRDKRCGVTAPIMKREMDMILREEELLRDVGDNRAGGVKVSFVNHVGGHKYAANLIMYKKNGDMIWLARCHPNNVRPIMEECLLGKGRVWADKVRLVQKTNPIEW